MLNAHKLFGTLNKAKGDPSAVELISHATDKSGPRFVAAVLAMRERWKALKMPSTMPVLRDWFLHGLLHERGHFMINSLPAGDIPEEQLSRLSRITFEKYMEMILPEGWMQGQHDAYLETAVAAKNIYKAAMSVLKMPAGPAAEKRFMDILTIEMFCDRFAMFLFENYQKQKVFKDILQTSGWPLCVHDLGLANYALQDAQAGQPVKLMAFLRKHGGSEVDVQKVVANLLAAEKKNVLIAQFGDPAITAEERSFFQIFLEHISYLSEEGTSIVYSDKHVQSSRCIAAAQEGNMAVSITERIMDLGL